jgi:hypothetical protein
VIPCFSQRNEANGAEAQIVLTAALIAKHPRFRPGLSNVQVKVVTVSIKPWGFYGRDKPSNRLTKRAI